MHQDHDPPQANGPNCTFSARPGTPPRPPYSPVTPVFAQLAPVQPNNGSGHPIVPPPVSQSESPTYARRPQPPDSQTGFSSGMPAGTTPAQAPGTAPGPGQGTGAETATATATVATEPRPPPVPISESDNPDAIALRSAISILQLQKQQSLRDIHALDRMKRAAAADPERFARELAAGGLSAGEKGFLNLNVDEEEEDEEGGGNDDGMREDGGQDPFTNLGKIPTPQNIVRMPPINWAKYQIVGEPLDKMHAEQLRRPSAGEPLQDRAPEHVLASPYRPLVDKLETPGKVRGVGKGKKS